MNPATAKTIENRKATSPLCMYRLRKFRSLVGRSISQPGVRPRVYGSSGTAAQMPSFDHPRKFSRERNENGRLPETFARPDLLYSGWASRGVFGVRHGAACLLERLPQAVPRLMSNRSVSGHIG